MSPAASINATPSIHPIHERLLRIYLNAKDGCRPHRMHDVFAEDGVFSTQLDFENDFHEGSTEVGIKAICSTFTKLGDACDNMYTVCLSDTVRASGDTLRCKWLVGMSERGSRTVRIAWGSYHWTFDKQTERAKRLHVQMDRMAVLQPAMLAPMVKWLSRLPEPWCSSEQLVSTAPAHPDLARMHRYFGAR